MKKNIIFILVLSLNAVIFSCSKPDASNPIEVAPEAKNPVPVPAPVPQVPTEITESSLIDNEGCLSSENLYQEFDKLKKDLPTYDIVTALKFNSRGTIRKNFKKLIAFYALSLAPKSLSDTYGIEKATQVGCKTLILNRADGDKKFNIKEASAKQLKAVAEDGEAFEYQIVSGKELSITKTFLAFDVPCGSEKTPIYVTATHRLNWSGAVIPEVIDSKTTSFLIDRDVLSLAAEAVGAADSEVYITDSTNPENVKIDSSRLRELTTRTPNPDLILCTDPAVPVAGAAVTDPPPPTGTNN